MAFPWPQQERFHELNATWGPTRQFWMCGHNCSTRGSQNQRACLLAGSDRIGSGACGTQELQAGTSISGWWTRVEALEKWM